MKERIPIEPLSEARWKKIDDAVFAALDAGGSDASKLASVPPPPKANGNVRRLLFIGSGLAVAAVILAFVLRAVLMQDKGDVAMNPSHIQTGDESSRLAIGESSLAISPSSSVVASGDAEHGVLVVLEKGKVECEVAPRKGRPPFVVQAGDVRVRVVGTRFAVERRANDVRVSVSHGAVEVSGGAETVMLHDGESWPRTLGAVDSAPPASVSAPLVVPSASEGPAPSATAPTSVQSAGPQISRDVLDQRAYVSAAGAEARDPDAAMATYKRLASGGGPWSQPALFAAGRLAADRGRSADAKRYLESYLSRYPHGANAEDARQILSRLQ